MSTSASGSPSIDLALLDRLKQHTAKIAAHNTPEDFVGSHSMGEIVQLINDIRAADELLQNDGRDHSPDYVSSATKEYKTVVKNLKLQLEMGKQLRKGWLENIAKLREEVTSETV